jgi:hypothetical protein
MLTDDHKDAVLSLIRDAHGEAVASWHKTVWNWKIETNPAYSADRHYRIGLIEDEKLVGAISLMPSWVKVGSTVHRAASTFGLVISSAMAEGGILENLLSICDEAVRLSPDLLYGNADERMTKVWEWSFGRDGVIGDYHRCHRVLALAPVLRARYSFGPLVRMLAAGAYAVVTTIVDAYAALRVSGDIEVRPVGAFDDSFEALWKRASSSHPNIVVRDRAFLNWRLRSLPCRDHVVLGAYRSGELQGYTALRFVEEGSLRKALIVDLFMHRDEHEIFRALLSASVTEARRQKATVISMLEVRQPELAREMRSLLFFKDKRSVWIAVNSTVLAPAEYDKSAQWWITLADTDLDLGSSN